MTRKIIRLGFRLSMRVIAIILIMIIGIYLYRLSNWETLEEREPLQVNILAAQDFETPTPSPTIPPTTPLPSLTPSQTLKPPPTLEPPTSTPRPTFTPSLTPTATLNTSISIPGLHGAATPELLPIVEGQAAIAAPTKAEGQSADVSSDCAVREDWGGVHVVQANEVLSTIAQQYGLTMFDLAAGNCLSDMNLISVGQKLRVPGEGGQSSSGQTAANSSEGSYTSTNCTPWELIIPVNNTINIANDGTISFEWRGPEAFRYLLRIIAPDGNVYETVFDLRQSQTIEASEIPLAGMYTWYVFPLDENFQQIACPEGGPWVFTKGGAPTATPTITPQAPNPTFATSVQGGTAPLEVQFVNQTSGALYELLWTFGDGSNWGGTPENARLVTHIYTTPGTYLITLWVRGAGGEASTSRFITVN